MMLSDVCLSSISGLTREQRGQKVIKGQLAGARAYCGGLPHCLFDLITAWNHIDKNTFWADEPSLCNQPGSRRQLRPTAGKKQRVLRNQSASILADGMPTSVLVARLIGSNPCSIAQDDELSLSRPALLSVRNLLFLQYLLRLAVAV